MKTIQIETGIGNNWVWLLALISFPICAQQGPDTGDPIKIAENINTDVVGEPLNYLVNTPYKELGPMPTKDGKRLYFSRQGYPDNTGGAMDEDIWYSEFDDATQTWTKAENIGSPLNNSGPNFVTGVSVDGDTLLLGNVYGKKGKMGAGVSLTFKTGNLWSSPIRVKITNDYNLSGKTGYDLSTDRTALIIAQEKVDSYGKLDLYVAFRDPDAAYPYSAKESINLGSVINSFGNETSPWLSYDNRTLYFSSDGHNGYGGLDIFMSKRLDNSWTHWSEPENLGPGINSPFDDMSFNYNPKSRYAYYARGLTSENSDIYRIDMTYLFKTNVTTDPQEIGQTEIVNYVFDDNSSKINPEAIPDLDKIVASLKKSPEMLIMISTHSNKHESRLESLRLSNERAISVMDYLVAHGILKGRLSYQGFGHDIVVNSMPNALNQGANIGSMVEFKLIGLNSASNN